MAQRAMAILARSAAVGRDIVMRNLMVELDVGFKFVEAQVQVARL